MFETKLLVLVKTCANVSISLQIIMQKLLNEPEYHSLMCMQITGCKDSFVVNKQQLPLETLVKINVMGFFITSL